jgi:hypothetical protein
MENGIDINYIQSISSNVSLFIPDPVSIYVTTNTFVKFKRESSTSDEVGMIIGIDVQSQQLQIRLFLSWVQLLRHIGPDRVGNISFWRRRNAKHPPFYLCDSDIVVEMHTGNVKGLAFMFHESDNVVRQLDGLANTYIVTSIYYSMLMKLEHKRSFFSFPCQVNEPLPLCAPSMIFEQVLKIKNKVQVALNTRSGKSRNVQNIQLDNVNRLTWQYTTKDAARYGVVVGSSYGVVQVTFMESDTCVVQKWRNLQESFILSAPEHFRFAKLLLGTSVGLGIRCPIRCNLKGAGHLERVENYHQISVGDTINAIKFDNDGATHVARGISFRYVPSTTTLFITI